MSNAPYLLPKARGGYRMGHGQLVDSMVHDGLWDAYNPMHMGSAAELCAAKLSIDRKAQDDYAIASYQRAQRAQQQSLFQHEIAPVEIPTKTGKTVISKDDEPTRVDFSKLRSLPTSFKKEGGTITAANASVISDGAAAIVLTSRQKATELGLHVLGVIRGYSDAAGPPLDYPLAPIKAIPIALRNARIAPADVACWEINEAFSVVPLAAMSALDIPHDKINILGGAVSLGHPIGCSGARILMTLLTSLRVGGGRLGVAAICNGGGGASAVVLERTA